MATLYGDITNTYLQSYIFGNYAIQYLVLEVNTQGIELGDTLIITNVNDIKRSSGALALKYDNTMYCPPENEKLYNLQGTGYLKFTNTEVEFYKNDTKVSAIGLPSSGECGLTMWTFMVKLLDGTMVLHASATTTSTVSNFNNYYDIVSYDIFPIIREKSATHTFTISYSTVTKNITDIFLGSEGTVDPYHGAGDSGTGGGDGTFDGTSDPVPIPGLPTVGATDSGFITLFAPTTSQLKALAYYMWINPLFDVETGFKKIFSDPMDCILGLSVVPVTVPTSGAQNVTVGNLVTSVSMNVASHQYIEVDCGTIDFTSPFFGSYLDYEPYTKMSLFVPYSGVHAVNADDIIGKTVTLKYHIDILTGSLVAFLLCGDSVLYEFNGACASNIPVNSMNYASTIENAIRIAVNIGTTVATAGAAAPATTATTTQALKNTAAGINLAGSTAEGALSLKPNIDRAGSLGGTTGIMGNQTPYFIITRPRLCKPKKQNFYKGYPSFIQCVIRDLEGKGYTEFDTVILSNTYLTDSEKDELIGILKGGVYL